MRSATPCTNAHPEVQEPDPRARRTQNGFLGRDVPIGRFGRGRSRRRVSRELDQQRGTRLSPFAERAPVSPTAH
jgi:hypothetical protein